MEKKVHVVTDSSSDMPPELLEAEGIEMVPLIVRFGDEVYDETNLSADDFWQKAQGPHHPQTSQPPVGRFEQVFARLVEAGQQVICATVTAKHSGTFNSARLAAERFGQAVQVFDSQSLSLGLALQALVANSAARTGQSLQEIMTMLEDLRARTRVVILLDSLESLRRGGRADAFIAAAERMTRALNIKLLINVVEGQLKLLGAARSAKGGLKRIVKMVEELGPLEHLAVAHTRSPALAEELAAWLSERTGFSRERIWVRETGAVLSTHAGRGVIAVMAVPAPQPG